MNTVFIIGYMGSGKSTMGKWLAHQWGCPFVDLDAAIEDIEGIQVSTIFKEKGEEYFRSLESAILRKQRGDYRVVSTGGGTPCHGNNMEWMNENGITVYLKASPGFLASRLIKSDKERPLLSAQSDLESFVTQHLKQRESFYEKAQIIVSALRAKKELLEKVPTINRGRL